MKKRSTIEIALLLLTLALLIVPGACTSADRGFSGKKGDSGSSGDDDDDDMMPADVPTSVAGSFLVECAEITGQGSKTSGSETNYGCGLYVSKDGSLKKAQDGVDVKIENWDVKYKNGDKVSYTSADPSYDYHIDFLGHPSDAQPIDAVAFYADNEFGIKNSASKTIGGEIVSCRIAEWMDCISSLTSCSALIEEKTADGTILKGFKYDATWDSGNLLSGGYHFDAPAICSNGVIFDQFGGPNADQYKVGGSFLNVLNSPISQDLYWSPTIDKSNSGEIVFGQPQCFNRFKISYQGFKLPDEVEEAKEDFVKGYDYVKTDPFPRADDPGCVFVRGAGSTVYIISMLRHYTNGNVFGEACQTIKNRLILEAQEYLCNQ